MKNTIIPALSDTPLLDYAKGFLAAGQMRSKQNVPGGAARNGMVDEQSKQPLDGAQERLLGNQIARAREEKEDLWSWPRGKPERKPPAPVPQPTVLGPEKQENKALKEQIAQYWDEEHEPPRPSLRGKTSPCRYWKPGV